MSAGFRAFAMGSLLGGRVGVPVHALDRIVGLPEPLTPSSFAMRSLWWVELAYLCSCSIVTKALTWIVLGFKFLCDGVTLLGSSVHIYECTRSEQRYPIIRLPEHIHSTILLHTKITIKNHTNKWKRVFIPH